MVESLKRCLRKALENARLRYDELLTILLEVEGTHNSRYLTNAYDEVSAEILTPSHLVYGRRLGGLPDEVCNEEEGEMEYLRKFRYLTRERLHFWNRWRREYVTDLREYHRNGKCEAAVKLKVGEVVLFKEDNVKRNSLKRGKVEVLIIGNDQVIRGAKLRVVTNGKPVYLN